MKLKLVYIINSVILFLITSPLMAADAPADLGDDPDVTAPIDDSLWVLVIVALIYVFLKFRAIQSKKTAG
jgi:hypothetical protein